MPLLGRVGLGWRDVNHPSQPKKFSLHYTTVFMYWTEQTNNVQKSSLVVKVKP